MKMALNNPTVQFLLILLSVNTLCTLVIGQATNQNCVLSFVVPRDKVKTSCNMEAKLKQRLISMETKVNMYKQQVSDMQAQLQKERHERYQRLTALEARLDAFDAESSYHKLQKKLESIEIILERKPVNTVQREKNGRHSSQSEGQGGTDSKVDVKGNDNLLAIIKPIIQSEIESYLENFTQKFEDKIKTKTLEYNEILHMLPRNDQSYIKSAGVKQSGKLWRKKMFNSKESETENNLENIKNKMNETRDKLVKKVENILKNVPLNHGEISNQNMTGLVNGSLEKNYTLVNNSYSYDRDMHSLREGSEDDNDTTENQEPPTSRISITDYGDTVPSAKSKGENKINSQLETEEFEELIKAEINTLLQDEMEEILSLMKKQYDNVENMDDLQNKNLDTVGDTYTEDFKQLKDKFEGLKLEVSSVTQALQDIYGKTQKIQAIQLVVDEIKKNMTNVASSACRVDNDLLQKVDINVKKLRTVERFTGIFQQSLQHYRNESKSTYMAMQEKLSKEMANVMDTSVNLYENLTSRFEHSMNKHNSTMKKKLNSMDALLRILEDNTVLLQMDMSTLERKVNTKHFKVEEGISTLRTQIDRLQRQDRNSQGVHDSMKQQYHRLALKVNLTAHSIESLQLEFKLSSTDSWIQFNFLYDTSRTACFEKQYIRKTKFKTGRIVGVILCSPKRYKIMLGQTVEDKFFNIGDSAGLGEDHCEFVGTKENAVIAVSPPGMTMKSEEGFARDRWGDEPKRVMLNFLRPSPAWYECGLSIP